jgi:hypothetical protein
VSRIGAGGSEGFQRFFEDDQQRPWRIDFLAPPPLDFRYEPAEPVRFVPIPEPSTALLIGLGLAGVAMIRRAGAA